MDFADVGELKKERKEIRTDRQLKRLSGGKYLANR
jgi:hypothetical protein